MLLAGIVIGLLSVCGKNSNGKKNVLYHYAYIDRDSLKLEAAKFLLENIPYHYSFNNIAEESLEWEQWRRESDSIMTVLLEHYDYDAVPRDTIKAIQAMRDTLLAHRKMPEIMLSDSVKWDSDFITSEFLIQHIDNAFEVWNTNPFAKKLTFEEFKEYILPYTSLRSYGFLTSGKRLNNIFSSMLSLDSAKNLSECVKRYNKTIRNLRDLGGKNRRKSPAGIYDIYVHDAHDCTDVAVWGCNILRACGVPAVVENVAGYRDFLGKHFHCSVYDCDSGKWYPFNPESSWIGHFNFDKPKCLNVYRQMFSAQKNTPYFLKGEDELVPDELSNPCIKDVSPLYMNVHKITLPCDTLPKCRLAYLAVFNAETGLKSVTWGVIDSVAKTATFDNVLENIMYMPVYYTDEGYRNFHTPFYIQVVDGKAQMKTIPGIDGDSATVTLRLTRKFPWKESMKSVAEGLVGGRFLGANRRDFCDADVLYTIEKTPQPLFAEYKFKRTGKYKFYRFQASENNPHANISHLEWITGKSFGYENVAEVTRVHCLTQGDTLKTVGDTRLVKLLDRNRNRMTWAKEYDGNMQTAPGAYRDITLTLDEAQTVTAVRFAPLNADNGITSGDTYLLRYWDNGWRVAGRADARYEYVEFKNVPKNKLYWLDNLTRGKEEMPFVVIDGEQRFIYDVIVTIED